jgi:hypothetical protein
MPETPKKTWPSISRLLFLATLGTVGSLCVAFVWAWMIDISERREAHLALDEMEAHSLGLEKPTPESFYPVEVVKRQPVLSGFRILKGEAAVGVVADAELVIGVEIDGHARAYPINIMLGPEREIFNDELGGRPIAATW